MAGNGMEVDGDDECIDVDFYVVNKFMNRCVLHPNVDTRCADCHNLLRSMRGGQEADMKKSV
jgi:hypothetical protein